jgi:hypothetical protein
LAELARLIGQSDPFAEFGQKTSGESPAPPAQPPPLDWNARPARPQSASTLADDQRYRPQDMDYHTSAPYGLPPVETTPVVPHALSPGSGHGHSQGYDNHPGLAPDYDPSGYAPEPRHGAGADGIYDDVPPPRRRISIMAIAGIFALVVMGTAGALGYRALFGSSGSAPPPVIMAETKPSKIVPPSKGGTQSAKLINDRIGEKLQGEQIVSREERPVQLNVKPPQTGAPANTTPQSLAQTNTAGTGPALASTAPKKIKTIVIRPDDPSPTNGPATTQVLPIPAVPAAIPATPEPQPTPPANRAAAAPLPITPPRSDPPPRSSQPRSATNMPLALRPDAVPTTARTASAPSPAPARSASNGGSSSGGYLVQVSSQRSEADAQSTFRTLQSRYPKQLGGRRLTVRRADLGSKGIYYRAAVGPFASPGEATELCNALKAAGGQCIIHRN